MSDFLVCPVCGRPPVDPIGPREDITSGNVWPDAEDPEYVEWLAQRVRDLERQLGRAEVLLAQYERWGDRALAGLDEVVARLVIEEHGPPPAPWRKGRQTFIQDAMRLLDDEAEGGPRIP